MNQSVYFVAQNIHSATVRDLCWYFDERVCAKRSFLMAEP